MSVLQRNNVRLLGDSKAPVMLFAHGFGCNQTMWDAVAAAFAPQTYQILFDYVGSGQSDLASYDRVRYASLEGYAQDILEICAELGIEREVIFVGHSVSCSIGVLAALARPGLFREMIFLGPSPCFLNDPPHYFGGFERSDLDALLDLMAQNYLGWAAYLAPVVAGADNDQQIAGKLSDSFCSTDPIVAQQFAKATFFADNRADFAKLTVPSLILQHQDDALAAPVVGQFLQQQLKNSQLITLPVVGHAAHMSHPDLVIAAISDHLAKRQIL